MRAYVLAGLALLASCDSLFGLVRDGDAGVGADALHDAPPDAPDIVLDLSVPGSLAVNDTVMLTAHVKHAPDETVAFTLAATGGSFVPAMGLVVLDGAGLGTISVSYRAPATAQTDMISLTVLGDTRRLDVPIHPINLFGNTTVGNGAQTFGPNLGVATSVAVAEGGIVRALGAWIGNPTGNVKLALYTEGGSGPSTKVAETAASLPINGRNEIPTISTPTIAPGPYWVVAVFDATTQVAASPTGAYQTAGLNYLAAFPMSLVPTIWNVQPGVKLQLFVAVAGP